MYSTMLYHFTLEMMWRWLARSGDLPCLALSSAVYIRTRSFRVCSCIISLLIMELAKQSWMYTVVKTYYMVDILWKNPVGVGVSVGKI